ncbi:MAG: hypothetical protein CMK07_11345 [Ponticaulis sp.]|nr:hypothetical protein [Ponticaulis sp.]
MAAQRFVSFALAAFLLAAACASVWYLIDEFQTQHLRRAGIAEIVFPETPPELASADRLDALATRALQTAPWQLDFAKSATQLSIAKNPRRISNWNRVVYIDVAENGQPTDAGINAIEESFFRSPFGEIEDMQWRLEFTNAYWASMPDDIKAQSLAQVTAIADDWRARRWLREFGKTSQPEITVRIERALAAID